MKTPAAEAMQVVPYSGSMTLAYTGGNGGAYPASALTSAGVEGLKATLSEGKLLSGEGTIVYTISGTPASTGTAIFNMGFGGKSCTVTVPASATVNTVYF